MKHLNKSSSLQVERLKAKLTSITAREGVTLDGNMSTDLITIMTEEQETMMQKFPQGSFQQIFWQQQMDAVSRKGNRKQGIRWHPLMIKWCLYLRHQSSKAYEALRDSGCIQLPSQRTLRDYSNCIKASAGFSTEVDRQLMKAAKLEICPDWHKLVVLLIDEMHIREGLVYNKHTGRMVGFVNLGDVNNHLLAFERSMDGKNSAADNVLATTVMAMMVKGLFTPLQFPYAQFACANVTGDLMFQPFWKAVYHLERMGFKVGAISSKLLHLYM